MSQKESAPDLVVNGGEGFPNATITAIRFEHIRAALGVGEDRPRLSWIVDTTTAGWRQTGYEIEAYGPEGRLRGQTGRGESESSPSWQSLWRNRIRRHARQWRFPDHVWCRSWRAGKSDWRDRERNQWIRAD